MDVERLRAERDLYRDLLDLAAHDDVSTFPDAAMDLVLDSTGAEVALIGVFEDGELVWSVSRGLSDAQRTSVLEHVSTGLLRTVIDSRETVEVPSALLDGRFGARESVRRNRIEAVLAVPLPWDDHRDGVLYLQRHEGGGPFPSEAREVAARLAHHLPGIGRPHLSRPDPTAEARGRLLACDLVGRSEALSTLLDQIASVAPLDIDVLLTGPSGSGKSHLARLIHDNSARAAGPFVNLNCAAIPESLFESEMFGSRAGAFSGSTQDREGVVQAARGGTLLLDEVGELSLPSQAKLLQLLQDRTYCRVGDPQPRQADLRIVAATNLDLDEAVRRGRFRADLRYRLEVLPLYVPGLATRRSDIRPLALHFVEEVRQRHAVLAGLTLSRKTLAALVHAPWPGNVRQLQHAVKAGLVRAHARGATVVEPRDVLDRPPETPEETWQSATRRFQRELLARTLEETGWNISEAARRLDLARSHTYDLFRGFGLERPGRDG